MYPNFQSRTRAAAKTMIFVVLTYLLSNILNVIIILWEYADREYLEKELLEFYMVAVDLVGDFLYIPCSNKSGFRISRF